MSKGEKSYWIKSGSYSILERIFGQFLGFGNMFLLLRAVSEAEYGLWIQFLIIVALIEVSRTGLIQNALIRYLSTSDKKDQGKINSASIFINVSLTLLTILLLVVLAEPAVNYFYTPSDLVPLDLVDPELVDPEFTQATRNELIRMLYFYGITTIAIMPFLQFNYILQANLDFKGFFWASFTYKGTLFCYILYQYLYEIPIDIFEMSLFLIFSGVAASVVGYFFAKDYLIFDKKIDRKWVKELFNFGKFTFGTNLSTIVYKFTDRSMLGAMISFKAIAIYEVAIRITNLVDIPAISIAAVIFPQSAKNSATQGKEAIKDMYERSVAAILALIIPAMIFIYFFAEIVVTILGKQKYLASVPILRYTILFALFVPFALQFGTILDSIGKPKINFRFVILGLSLNIIFNYLFINEWGIMGAVYGTLLTYSVMFVIQMSFFYKWYGILPWRPFVLIPWFYKKMYTTLMDMINKK